MIYAQERRRLVTAIRRLERASTTGAPLARLRLVQTAEASLLAVAGVLRHDIGELAGEVLRERRRA